MQGEKNEIGAPGFRGFMEGEAVDAPLGKVLVQAIAIITTSPGHRDCSPNEIYTMLVERAEKIDRDNRRQEEAENYPVLMCPECGHAQFDFDGFGLLVCARVATGECGYCTHLSKTARYDEPSGTTTITCDSCGRIYEEVGP